MGDDINNAGSPVAAIDTNSQHKKAIDGMALCLSGGGYRAMQFHVGSLWRMNEAGLLPINFPYPEFGVG